MFGGALLFVLGGCGGASGGNKGSGPYTGQIAISHLTSNIVGAPFFIARDEGLFNDAGVNLELVETSGGAGAVRAVAQTTQIGAPSTPATFTAAGKGMSDLRIISGLFNTPAHTLYIAPKNRDVSRESLRGKKIGTSSAESLTTYFSDVIASELGLSIGGKDADIERIFVGGTADAWNAARQGLVDVAWSAPPFATKLLEEGSAKVVLQASEFRPSFVSIAGVATQSFIDEHPDAIEGSLRGLADAINLMTNEPGRAAKSWARAIDISQSVAEAAIQEYASSFGIAVDAAGLRQGLQAAVDIGQLPAGRKPDLDNMIVERFIPQGARVRREGAQ